MPKALDLTGQKFGKLTAIERAPNKGKRTYWLCRCDCGREEIIQTSHLTCGITARCKACAKTEGLSGNNLANYNFQPREQTCPICQKTFINKQNNRYYCYDCIPESALPNKRQFYKGRAFKHMLVGYKGGKCEICGYNKCEGALEFHHINPEEKDIQISKWDFNYNQDINKYLAEVDKCMLLCANCHREQHYKFEI